MGEVLCRYAALRQAIIADRGRCLHAFLDIAGFDQVAIPACPDSGIAIGLQLDLHLNGVALGLAGADLRIMRLVQIAHQVLHMVADLMRDDIGLCEVARRLEPL